MCNLRLPFCSKQQSTYFIAGSSFFLIGTEYAVIIPTLNLYLASMGASAFFMGFCLSAMSLTSLLSAPIFGRISDITRTTKSAVVISNFFSVGGNILYAVSESPYMVVISRFIVGIAAGSTASILGMISRSTTKEERTRAITKIFASRQTGWIIGPGFNLFLKNSDFCVFSYHVNSYNSPGFFMAALWFLEMVLMILFYHDLQAVTSKNNTDSNFDDDFSTATSQTDNNERSNSKKLIQTSFWSMVYNDIIAEESILILFISFVVMFVQMGMEAAITPLTKVYFNWGVVSNSIYYAGQGMLCIISMVTLNFVSTKVRDRYLALFGLTFMTLASLLFVVLVTYANHQSFEDPPIGLYIMFITYGAICGPSMPYVWVPLLSLFTKFTSEANQGFSQGVRTIFIGLGTILGPIWASSLLNNLILMTSVNLGLYLLIMMMLLVSYKQIVRRERRLEEDNCNVVARNEESATETSPLLTNA